MGAPAGLVEHQEPGVAVELLEHRNPGVNRRLGRGHARGRPRFHQGTMLAKIAATIAAISCAVLIQSVMPADPRTARNAPGRGRRGAWPAPDERRQLVPWAQEGRTDRHASAAPWRGAPFRVFALTDRPWQAGAEPSPVGLRPPIPARLPRIPVADACDRTDCRRPRCCQDTMTLEACHRHQRNSGRSRCGSHQPSSRAQSGQSSPMARLRTCSIASCRSSRMNLVPSCANQRRASL